MKQRLNEHFSTSRLPNLNGDYCIVVGLEEGYLECGLWANNLQRYCEAVYEIAFEHVSLSDQYNWMGFGYYPQCTLHASSPYLMSRFIWLVGHYAYPEAIHRDVDYLVDILLEFASEYERPPLNGGVRADRNSVFFMVQ